MTKAKTVPVSWRQPEPTSTSFSDCMRMEHLQRDSQLLTIPHRDWKSLQPLQHYSGQRLELHLEVHRPDDPTRRTVFELQATGRMNCNQSSRTVLSSSGGGTEDALASCTCFCRDCNSD